MVLERWDSRLLRGSLPPEVAEQDQGKCFNLQSEAWSEPPFQEISTRVEQQRWESPGSRAKCVSQCARLYKHMIICRYMMREAVVEKSLTEPRKKWGNAGRPASTTRVPAQPQECGHHSDYRPTLSLKGLSQVWEERVPPGQGRARRPWVERETRAPEVCPADCCTPVPGDPGGRRPAVGAWPWAQRWKRGHSGRLPDAAGGPQACSRGHQAGPAEVTGALSVVPHTTKCPRVCRRTTTGFLGSVFWGSGWQWFCAGIKIWQAGGTAASPFLPFPPQTGFFSEAVVSVEWWQLGTGDGILPRGLGR